MGWGFVAFLSALILVYAAVTGWLTTQLVLRAQSRGSQATYKKWGVEEKLFRPGSAVFAAGLALLFLAGLGFMSYVTFISVNIVADEPHSVRMRVLAISGMALYAFVIGAKAESQRINKIKHMTRQLVILRAHSINDFRYQNFSRCMRS